MTSRHMCAYALSSILLLSAGVAVGQTDKPDPAKAELAKQREAQSAKLQAGIEKAAHLLENNPRFPDCTPDTVNGFHYLHEAYTTTDKKYTGKVTVPTLWDNKTRRIANNESSE